MKARYDLSQLDWKLSGWTPHIWRMQKSMEIGASPNAEISSIKANVPGSVQYSLREAGIIPDWNVGLNARKCEWVENRHWIYETFIPDDLIESGKTFRLNCRGLDYCGCVMINGQMISEFKGSHVPYVFDITPYLTETGNVLRIAFETPPRWLGQFGYTSQMTDWKPRFNYTWDWIARLVQVGITGPVFLEVTDGNEINEFRCFTDADASTSIGQLVAKGRVSADENASVKISLIQNDSLVAENTLLVSEFNTSGASIDNIKVDLWWPNMCGEQSLYTVVCCLLDSDGNGIDITEHRVGFKNITWKPCEGTSKDNPYTLCVVNGKPIFLQGINWTPILPNYADVTNEDYKKRLELYKDLGLNMVRVWGGASLEREYFYDLCDELGLMVWQEFPMSSSGIENWPPEDTQSIEEMAEIAKSYITRRQHHASLFMWCGGNELTGGADGCRAPGCDTPVTYNHPMIGRLKSIVGEYDSTRRFIPTSPNGLAFSFNPANAGKGINGHVHGPWKAEEGMDQWAEYWACDDTTFRSETGAPGASSVEIIRRYAGECDVMPASASNPLWRRPVTWWIEWDRFIAEHGREANDLEEYVAWNQERQKQALTIAAKACKNRFPRCGGFIVWMGHDCFPCTANTSIVDFHGNPKPAALGLKEIFRQPVNP